MKKFIIVWSIIILSAAGIYILLPNIVMDHLATVPVEGKPYSIKVYSSVGGATIANETIFYKSYLGLFNVYMSDTTFVYRVAKYDVINDTLILVVGGRPKYNKKEWIMKIKIE